MKTEMSRIELNELAKQYEPLLCKITNQFIDGNDYDLVRGGAEYGLVYAINTYDSTKGQTFTQYSAWCMRNFILNDLRDYSTIVKHDTNSKFYEDVSERVNDSYEVDFDSTIDESSMVNVVKREIEKRYSKDVCEIFYHSLNLFGREEMSLTDLARKYHKTVPGIHQQNKRIMEYLRKNENVISLLK